MLELKEKFPVLGSWTSISSLLESQRERLAAVVQLAKAAPFYRDRLSEDFFAAPLTLKDDLRQASPFGFLALPRWRIATYHESSGTSGEPTSSFFSDEDWEDVTSRFLRSAVDIGVDDAVLVKTPYSMVTTAHQMHQAARARGAMVVPADNRSTNMPYTKVVRLLSQIPVTVAWCMPTEVLLWAEAARLRAVDATVAFPNLRAFLVAGEPLSPAKRRRMEEAWGDKKVYQDYGSTETGSLAGECSEGRLHLWADRVYCEVWNETEKTFATTGKGKLVVTSLYRKAMPLIRYCLEDTVEISHAPCPCGWQLPRLTISGRAESALSIQGKAVFPVDIEECVYSLPKKYGVVFWRARHGAETLDVEIEGRPESEKAARRQLQRIIAAKLGITAAVRAVTDEIVSRSVLTRQATFQKPRFVFSAQEDWSNGIHY